MYSDTAVKFLHNRLKKTKVYFSKRMLLIPTLHETVRDLTVEKFLSPLCALTVCKRGAVSADTRSRDVGQRLKQTTGCGQVPDFPGHN